MVRLEHLFDTGEDEELSRPLEVDLSTLFTNFSLQAVQEKLLGANVDLNRHSMLAEKIKCSVWFKSIKYLFQRLMV